MAFYETQATVVKALADFVTNMLESKGLDPVALDQQHTMMHQSAKDHYSRALLLRGVKAKDAPVFSNIPYLRFAYAFDNDIEIIFNEMGIATTQKEMFDIAGKLRKRNVAELFGAANIMACSVIQKEIDKIEEWVIEARGILAAMGSNMHLLATVTEEQKQFAELFQFDWYYDYSDDHSVWRAGSAHHKEVSEKIRSAIDLNPSLMTVVETIAAAYKKSVSFFIGN